MSKLLFESKSTMVVAMVAMLAALGAAPIAWSAVPAINENFELLSKNFDSMFGFKPTLSLDPKDLFNLLDHFLYDILPPLNGQRPYNENGTRPEFKAYALADESNDDAAGLTTHQLIARSGYKYTVHEALADDGYITMVTRIINPKANLRYLRKPPVILTHGGTVDTSIYVISSGIQHFPEKWPRVPEDGPITSWNRSFAFMLANNGFDVWLAETRGSNEMNKRHIKSKAFLSILKGKNMRKNMTTAEMVDEVTRKWNYWDFSQDDIIAHEYKSHIDTVMRETGSKEVSLISFSLSTPTALAFVSTRPDYARKIRGFISIAPIVTGRGFSNMLKLMLEYVCPLVPDTVGTLVWSDMVLSTPVRMLVLAVGKSKAMRYSVIKAFVNLLFGESCKWQTLIELNTLGHMMRDLSFREAKQLCQQTARNRLQKFDYGPVKNLFLYNSTTPPLYDLSNLQLSSWIVISGETDAIANNDNYEDLYNIVNPKPSARFLIPGYNHLDLVAGFENDRNVNFPMMNYLASVSDNDGADLEAAGSRGLRSLLPPQFEHVVANISSVATNLTKSITKPKVFLEILQKSFADLLNNFGESIRAMRPKASLTAGEAQTSSNYPSQ